MNLVVTGGAGFLGLEACRALLEHGASALCICDTAVAFSHAFQDIQHLEEDFPRAKIIRREVDVTDESSVQTVFDDSVRELGPINMLLCFAGVVSRENALDINLDTWKRSMDINVTGSWICAQRMARCVTCSSRTLDRFTYTYRHMISHGEGGSIVLVASISGHTCNFPQPQASYNTSKAAVIHLARALAAEWARYHIRVNTVSPGYMETDMTRSPDVESSKEIWTERNPMGRIGDPEELMGAVVLLSSKYGGRYMTGTDIIVDGESFF